MLNTRTAHDGEPPSPTDRRVTVSLDNVDVRFNHVTSAADVFVRGTDDKFWQYCQFFDSLAGFVSSPPPAPSAP